MEKSGNISGSESLLQVSWNHCVPPVLIYMIFDCLFQPSYWWRRLYEPEIWFKTKKSLLLIIQALSFYHSYSGEDCECVCIKTLYFSQCSLLIQGSCVHPEKLFEANTLQKLSTATYVTQPSDPRLFFEGICMPTTDSPLLVNWLCCKVAQYCDALVTLGKNRLCKSVTTYSASITRTEKRTFKYWKKGCPSSLEIFLVFPWT